MLLPMKFVDKVQMVEMIIMVRLLIICYVLEYKVGERMLVRYVGWEVGICMTCLLFNIHLHSLLSTLYEYSREIPVDHSSVPTMTVT